MNHDRGDVRPLTQRAGKTVNLRAPSVAHALFGRRPMKRAHTLGIVAAVLCAATAADASTFEAASGVVRLDAKAAFAQTFDDAESLGKLPMRTFRVSQQSGYSMYQTSSQEPTFIADGIEGAGAMRVAGDQAVLLGDPVTFAPLAQRRVEVTFFARAAGALPSLHVIYGRRTLDDQSLSYPTGDVVAIRTGRETSDGWIEYTSGPIDGSAYNAPIVGLLFAPAAGVDAKNAFVVDALEIRTVGDALLGRGECHVATETKDCAKGAVCMEGVCIDGAVAYGALPPAATRKDIVARALVHMRHFQGDRHAVANAAKLEASLPALAETADGAAAFYRPYLTALGALRAAHTAPPSPNPFSRLAAGASGMVRYYGSELNVCFGIVEKDLAGGGRGFGVYATATPSPLAVGDVLDTIDGEPVDAWLARLAAEHGLLAADADSDAPTTAGTLPALVMRFARTVGARRCTGPGACQSLSLDVNALRREAATTIKPLSCSPRFQLGVDVPNGVDPDAYETIITQSKGSVTTVHTNGEPWTQNDAWVTSLMTAFSISANGFMLVDKRRGDGGGGAALEAWGSGLRRGPELGHFFVDRIGQSAIDGPPGYMDDLLARCDGRSRAGKCVHGQLETYAPAAGAAPRKIAWLTVLDGSASDMSTSLAKGAPGVRIFGPNRTIGLFGGLNVMGAFLEGWSGGAVQMGDTREGNTNAERVAGAWRSGRGVEPDEIVVQTQSDLVAGRDTMLLRAHAWLASP